MRISENANVTEDAERLYKEAQVGLARVFQGKSTLYPTEILDVVSFNQNESAENAFLLCFAFSEMEKELHARKDPVHNVLGIAATKEEIENHYGGEVRKGVKGIPILATEKFYGTVRNMKVGLCYELSTQVYPLEPLPPMRPGERDVHNFFVDPSQHDYVYDELMDKMNDCFAYSDNPVVRQMAKYITGWTLGQVTEEQGAFLSDKESDMLNDVLIDYYKNKSVKEIADDVNLAIASASDAIDVLKDYVEYEVENVGQYYDAEIFGVYVLCASPSEEFRTGMEDAPKPLNMYTYEIYTKGGRDFVAKKTPEDGEFKDFIVTANALPLHLAADREEGLCVGDTFSLNDNRDWWSGELKYFSIADYRFDVKQAMEEAVENSKGNVDLSHVSFCHNKNIVECNESVIMQKPSEYVQVYGVYNAFNQLIDAGFFELDKVPEDDEDFERFAENYRENKDKNACEFIFNCNGKFTGWDSGEILPENELNEFITEHGGPDLTSVNGKEKAGIKEQLNKIKMNDRINGCKSNIDPDIKKNISINKNAR